MDAIDYVDTMPKADFRHRILRGAARSTAFSRLLTFGAERITAQEKAGLCEALQAAGGPIRCEKTAESDLLPEELCKAISSRAIQRR